MLCLEAAMDASSDSEVPRYKVRSEVMNTWLAKPTPAPRQTRPMMSMARSWANAHRMAPTQKEAPPRIMTSFLPPMRVTGPVKKLKKAPAANHWLLLEDLPGATVTALKTQNV